MFKIRKLLILTVLFAVVGIISGCSTEMLYGEDDERGYKPMSAEQFAEFDAYFNGHDRTQSSFLAAMIGDYDLDAYSRVFYLLPEGYCHELNEADRQYLERMGYSATWGKYRRSEAEVHEFMRQYATDEYVDSIKDMWHGVNSQTYVYDRARSRFIFYRINYIYSPVLLDGYTRGDKVLLVTNRGSYLLEKRDDRWIISGKKDGLFRSANITDRMERMTVQELYEFKKRFVSDSGISRYRSLVDAYKNGDIVVAYREWQRYVFKRGENGFEQMAVSAPGVGDYGGTHYNRNLYEDSDLIVNIQYTVDDRCIPENETESDEYNKAIDAYNSKLAGRARELLEAINSDNDNVLILAYVYDLNHDGTPELIMYSEYMYPRTVFTFADGEVRELIGPNSNGQHGSVHITADEKYASMHSSIGWWHTFVTYNRDNTQTVEVFYSYSTGEGDKAGYYKYIATYPDDGSSPRITEYTFSSSEKDQAAFEKMYEPYKQSAETYLDMGPGYSPFEPVYGLNYSPEVLDRLETLETQ